MISSTWSSYFVAMVGLFRRSKYADIESLKNVAKSSRKLGRKYLDTKERPGIWNGKILLCEHDIKRS